MKNDEKKKFSFSKILNNNRFLMIISIIIAFGIWIWVAVEKSPEVQTVISGVPIKIDLENSIPQQLGLQIFGKSDFTVDVTVKGKKYVVSNLTADNISAEANVNYVDGSGTKTLQLKITPKSAKSEFSIVSSSTNYIEVFFDVYKEIELPVIGEIETDLSNIVIDGCILGEPVCSQQTVNVSGPATEINRITRVNATIKTNEVLDKTTTFETEIKLISNDNGKLEYSKINANDKITMTVPVLKIVTLPTAIDFKNAPSYYISNPLQYSVSPSSVKVAIPVENIETTTSIIVDTIDFADILNNNNSFRIKADDVSGYKILDENVKQFNIRVNASGIHSKILTVPSSSISINNQSDFFNVNLESNKPIAINVVGQKSDLDSIDPENIKIQIDTFDKILNADTKTITAKIILPSDCNCWVTGKYDIKVNVSEK